MGKRGPDPKGKIHALDVEFVERPSPPPGMTTRARNLFQKIVKDNSVSAFDVESVSLLRAFCEADNQHYLATKELKKHGAVMTVQTKDGEILRRSPWFDVQKESAATMSSLSTKLRNKGVTTSGKDKQSDKKNSRKGLLFGT